jgi:hypothetical protein
MADFRMADTKDWTWVLERTCPECGFDARALDRGAIGSTTRATTQWYVDLLTSRDDDQLRQRPQPDVWSALEYGCHIRDVFRVMRERLQLMLDEDEPHFPNWDQDATALDDDYPGQDPSLVRVELATEGDRLADLYDTVRGDQWDRRGFRSNGSVFTVESLGRYMVHDIVHHVWDLETGGHPGAG